MKMSEIKMGERYGVAINPYRLSEAEVIQVGVSRTMGSGKTRRDGVMVRTAKGEERLVLCNAVRHPWEEVLRRRAKRQERREEAERLKTLTLKLCERLEGGFCSVKDYPEVEIEFLLPLQHQEALERCGLLTVPQGEQVRARGGLRSVKTLSQCLLRGKPLPPEGGALAAMLAPTETG